MQDRTILGDEKLNIAMLQACPIAPLRLRKPFWSVHGLHGFTFRGVIACFVLYLKETCCALPTCAQGLAGPTPEGKEKSTGFLLVIILHWSVWVCLSLFACGTGLNNRDGISVVHAEGGTPSKYTNKNSDAARTKIQIRQTNKNGTNKYKIETQRATSKDARKCKPREDVRAKSTKVVFFGAHLFVQIQHGRNYVTRRCSGIPK